MKITALLPDDLIARVTELSGGATTTESLLTALKEWVSIKELSAITDQVQRKPLKFREKAIADKTRSLNRRQS